MITLCQCNIHDSGKWSGRRGNRATFRTAGRFADFVASVNPPSAALPQGSPYPPIGVIGMQELRTEDDRLTINAYLEEATHVTWSSERTAQGVCDASGIGMFWRPDLVETLPEWNCGETQLCQLRNGYIIKFMGKIFKTRDCGETFGLFTGKLAWGDAVLDKSRVTREQRREQAAQVRSWISSTMSCFPDAIRIVMCDLNSGVGSPAWHEMNHDYMDPSRQHTFSSLVGSFVMDKVGTRLDYIWLDRCVRGGKTGKFIFGPQRSPRFGSDHRAVWATVSGVG